MLLNNVDNLFQNELNITDLLHKSSNTALKFCAIYDILLDILPKPNPKHTKQVNFLSLTFACITPSKDLIKVTDKETSALHLQITNKILI